MPRPRDPDDPSELLTADLAAVLTGVPLLQPATPEDPAQRRLWRACELCTFLEYRLAGAPDPRALTDQTIRDWARRGLTSEEAPADPTALSNYRPYWILSDGRCLGTVAVAARDPGWGQPCLWIASLYLFPSERRGGTGTRVMATLDAAARHLGLGGVRLETEWLWQGAVRFYLRQGFWVANWKRRLSLVRYFEDPPYRIRQDPGQLAFVLGASGADLARITARRRDDTLIWEEQPRAWSADPDDGGDDGADDASDAAPGALDPLASPASTFALWLAVRGWPLIRGPAEWEHRYHWSDTGMPEGLAYKITVFEGYARRCGFRVDTPRIPGLAYPPWENL